MRKTPPLTKETQEILERARQLVLDLDRVMRDGEKLGLTTPGLSTGVLISRIPAPPAHALLSDHEYVLQLRG
jgi:hypothetical protein